MKWVLEHLQVVIVIAASVAYWLNHRKHAGLDAGEADDEAGTAHRPAPQNDVQDQERARRIREEIRRKIAERSGSAPVRRTEPAMEPPPVTWNEPAAPRRDWRTEAEEKIRREEEQTAAVLARQNELREQIESLERANPEEPAQVPVSVRPVAGAPQAASKLPGGVRQDLRDRAAIRRAIVLREVLGPPVGLR
ncbi:MAG: hypothetical protein ACHQ5A_00960 [Opitutales bacterium]